MSFFRHLALGLVLTLFIASLDVSGVEAQEPFRLMPGVRFLAGMENATLLVSGETLIPAGGQPGSGTRVDVNSTLGIEYAEATSVTFRAAVWDTHFLDFGYLMSIPTGVTKVPHSFRFQNKTYPAGTQLETRIDLNWMRCSYGYKLAELSSQWIGPTLGVHYVTFAATINGESEEAGIISNTRRLDGVFPVLGLQARYLLPLGLEFSMDVEGVYLFSKGYLAMLSLAGTWEVLPNVVMTASVSSRMIQYLEDNQLLNNEWTYGLNGVSVGIMFGF